MNITLQVILNTKSHNVSPEKETRRYRQGDIVDVYQAVGPPDGPLGFIHIIGFPNKPYQQIRNRLIIPIYNPVIPAERLRRRRWTIQLPDMAQLIADKEITMPWGQVRPYIRRKIVVNTDPAQDDVSNEIADTDLD